MTQFSKNDIKYYEDFFNNLDYIVVGSGPGGCATAKVLTDNDKIKVLMVEAGEDQDNNHLIKESYNAPLLEEEYYSKFFWTVPQVFQENAPEMSANYTNGRLFGGGSSVNGEQYVRGTPYYYDIISNQFNDPDWNSENVKKLFTENFGIDKLIHTRISPFPENENGRTIINAMIETLNVKEIFDYNNFSQDYNLEDGVFTQWNYYQNKDGTRCSSSTSILKSVLYNRNNFIISPNSTVVKILFLNNKAIGVSYYNNGNVNNIYCKKGVILCAGTQTNVILQTSGIGNIDILKQNNIPVIVDSPQVGNSLYNHLLVYTSINIDTEQKSSDDINALYSFGGFLSEDNGTPRGSEWIGIDNNNGTMSIVILQLKPKSNGYCNVQSKDYLTVPLVSEAALQDSSDKDWFINILKNKFAPTIRYLQKTNPKYSFNSPCEDTFIGTDEEVYEKINEYIQSGNLEHAHHWTAQCKIGDNINNGVVNSDGKVYGCENLYVADTSIFPYPYDGNTAGLAYIIGFIIGQKLSNHIIK